MNDRNDGDTADDRTATGRFRLVFGAIALALAAVVVAIVLQFRGGSREATSDDAVQLVSVVERIRSPETGPLGDPDYVWRRFDDGSWIAGFGREPRADQRARSVIAVKDSGGAVRLFFGPVDGARSLKTIMDFAPSLAEFYVELLERRGFIERVKGADPEAG